MKDALMAGCSADLSAWMEKRSVDQMAMTKAAQTVSNSSAVM
jgi:hypothetical protein